MDGLLNFRERLLNIYTKNGDILLAVLKFIVSGFIFFSMSSLSLGSMKTGTAAAISVFFGLLCTVISPFGFYLLVTAASAIYLYTVSIELCIIAVLAMFILGVFYIRLFPKEALVIPALLIGFRLNVPYAVVIFAGLYIGLSGVAPVILGSIVWGVIMPCLKPMIEISPKANYELLSAPDKLMDMFKILFETISSGNGYIKMAVFYGIIAAVIALVNKFFIINYIKEFLIVITGIILMIGTILINGTSGIGMNPGFIIVGGIVSIIIMFIIRFFDNILDYKSAERVQFEDDDYYYYVKAVPKVKSKRRRNRRERIEKTGYNKEA